MSSILAVQYVIIFQSRFLFFSRCWDMYEWRKKGYCTFVDLEKVYYNVNRLELLNILHNNWLLNAISALYDELKHAWELMEGLTNCRE